MIRDADHEEELRFWAKHAPHSMARDLVEEIDMLRDQLKRALNCAEFFEGALTRSLPITQAALVWGGLRRECEDLSTEPAAPDNNRLDVKANQYQLAEALLFSLTDH